MTKLTLIALVNIAWLFVYAFLFFTGQWIKLILLAAFQLWIGKLMAERAIAQSQKEMRAFHFPKQEAVMRAAKRKVHQDALRQMYLDGKFGKK